MLARGIGACEYERLSGGYRFRFGSVICEGSEERGDLRGGLSKDLHYLVGERPTSSCMSNSLCRVGEIRQGTDECSRASRRLRYEYCIYEAKHIRIVTGE